MKGLSTELKVGIFAIIVLVILSFMTFKVGGLDWFRAREGYIVYTYFKNIAGLDEKTKVKVAGVDAGVIKQITLADGTAKLALRMDPEVKLYSDACASIKATGLLGDKYLEVAIGTKDPLLKEGDTLRCVQEVMDIDGLIKNLSNVSSSLNDLIVRLNKSLTDEDIDMLRETVANLRDTSGNFKTMVSENDMRLRSAIDNISQLASDLGSLVSENKDSVNAMVSDLKDFSHSLKSEGPVVIENLSKASKELRAMAEEGRPELKSFTEKANTAAGSLTKVAERLEKGEGTLGKLLKDEKLYDSINKTVEGVDRTLSSIERFRTFLTFQADYLTKAKEGKGHFYVTLQPKKEKYYIIGIVSDPIGTVETTETTTDGVTVKEETTEKKIEFSAYYARRHEDTALRLGITENTFGIGVDRFFIDDRLKVSVDAWDFSKDEEGAKNAHVRVGADYLIFKNLFVTGGIDNIFNSKNRGAYFGGGLRFEDEDFKYLFGTIPRLK